MENKELKITLSKPYIFEGTDYTEIDLSGLNNLTGRDFREIELAVSSHGQSVILAEQTINGTNAIAAKCTGFPLEFFEGLFLKDALAIRNTVMVFLA